MPSQFPKSAGLEAALPDATAKYLRQGQQLYECGQGLSRWCRR